MKTIEVSDKNLDLCNVKAKLAAELSFDELESLINWCNWQDSNLWEDMSLQEILNVYRVSAEYISWEDWALEDRKNAHKAWNSAVINPQNKMVV